MRLKIIWVFSNHLFIIRYFNITFIFIPSWHSPMIIGYKILCKNNENNIVYLKIISMIFYPIISLLSGYFTNFLA